MTNILDRYPRGRNASSIDHACERPFKTVSISADGRCYICICESWLPISVGNIDSFQHLEEVWSNPIANKLQKDIANKDFTHCAVEHCGITHRDIRQHEYRINVTLDDSCNLACPSCRRQIINYTEGEVYQQRLSRVKHFLKLLENFHKPMSIILIGSGDPLSSAILRPVVLEWQPKLNQKVILFTNGLLMKKLLPHSKILPNISEFQISVDAGTKEIYEQVRRPAKYEIMRENLDWLRENRPPQSSVILKFTVSSTNATDVENFVNMCDHYGFRGEITKLDDWGTFDNFNDHEVIDNTNHKLHTLAVSQLRAVSKNKNILLSPYFSKLL